MRIGFPEPEARVPADLIKSGACRKKNRFSLFKVVLDFAQKVVVDGLSGLHRAGRSFHVHDHKTRAAFGCNLHGPGHLERAHVVENAGAGLNSRTHHFGLAGVNRHGITFRGQGFDDRHDAREFLFDTDVGRAGPCGLPAHVENVGALAGKLAAPGNGVLNAVVRAAVGKRVGRGVDNAHH